MPLDSTLSQLRARISPAQRAAFLACFVSGYLVHLFAFTNLIPNSDGLSRVFDPQQMTISGRWFLHYASALNQFTQMPAVIGFFSVLFLSLAAAVAVHVLRLRSRTLSALAGALMAAFPCVGYTFLYLFTASAYCLAILLAVLSVYLAQRGKLGWLGGTVLLALCMGTYQAYVTVAIGLSVLAVLREILDPEASFGGTLRLGLRLVCYLAAGAVLYYVLLLVFLKVKNLELLSYLGMDAASSGYPFARLPGLILSAYKQVVAFFFVPGSANAFATGWMAALDLGALALGLVCVAARLGGTGLRGQLWRPVSALAMAALLPLGLNFSQIISPYSAPTPLMKYSFVLVYLAVLMLADLADGDQVLSRLRSDAVALTLVWGVLVLVFCLNTNNLLYTASAQAHRATESYATRLLSRVESCPGYQDGMEVAIIGAIPADKVYASIPSYAQVDHYSVPIHTVAPLNKHIYFYLNDWLNVPLEEPEEQVMRSVAASPEFAQMPLYPSDGSVRVVDGRVVVKIQETYTPKSDFEIAYENRR